MLKINYKKTDRGYEFSIAGFKFILNPEKPQIIEAENNDAMIFNPDCIIAIDDDCIVIAS